MNLVLALLLAASPHWPQFRGADAAGRGDRANLHDTWSAADGKGIALGQPLMATPAISEGLLIVRGERDLFAVGAVTRR